jgi:hypothetical protein
MTTAQEIKIAQRILETGLVNKVYYSTVLLRDEQNGQRMFPAYQRGADFVYVGPDDTQGLFAYIRLNGEISSVPFKIESCGGSSQITVPLRVVFFNDNEDRDHSWLLLKLASFTFMRDITLQRVIDDRFRLAKEESDLYRTRFDGKTFFVAFDVFLKVLLLSSQCEDTKPCESFPNPICKA